jgi:predicted naringenin-chalcone synthase
MHPSLSSPKIIQIIFWQIPLFADGAAAVIMCNDAVRTKSKVNLRVKGFHSYLLDKGKELMGWDIKPT